MLFRVITQLSRPFRLSNLESEAGVKVKNEYFILKLKKTKDLKTEINSYGKTNAYCHHDRMFLEGSNCICHLAILIEFVFKMS